MNIAKRTLVMAAILAFELGVIGGTLLERHRNKKDLDKVLDDVVVAVNGELASNEELKGWKLSRRR